MLLHLLAEQKVLGPRSKAINNSGLGVVKRFLCGLPPFLGGERYLLFGSEMHRRALENKKGKWTPYNKEEADSMEGGHRALQQHKLFQELKRGAIIEKKVKRQRVFGIHAMHGTLDINNRRKKLVVDLKTTSCTTEEDFVRKAIKLGYPRQGIIYEALAGYKNSLFIGISKKNIEPDPFAPPIYPVFLFDLNDFQHERQKAREEAEFLLTFYKQYGLPKAEIQNIKRLEQ